MKDQAASEYVRASTLDETRCCCVIHLALNASNSFGATPDVDLPVRPRLEYMDVEPRRERIEMLRNLTLYKQ